ncbi:hypothetical protein FOPG_06651 [Fusarium oxysporum f. sp. conglutinans race 2 54008]|uniref:Uncharacterized protein n=3 Tax=Fusarium oxysporum f. sp. conglutinans TaxID=100902 RepID=A0A8H6LL01_FUSOX|nr:hypothetical protein FOXB_01468 [Fusarium oxysporum f. sp. conglutinans Fo5176]EXL79346.1 hypothetical protein FOPG_06651 [Fusarium oxysporum f. sp. conglutinans race 2 54008]KAF6523518.1 hypothetical protein HZS61_012017 [Fusarium oxysporum f. sp. conglutinans]KAG6985117.1 hypothetical protein FocnCong_v005010 [Fusarium oxysporum f. sp. conglutinans]KAI8410515.1 hypothetical protein FOFC_10371 [Fusarium oxysporum]
MMDLSNISRRAIHGAGGLGLGWILTFSIGGAILLFAAIGFLLTWRVKSRDKEDATTVYQVSENVEDHRRSIFTKRLVKRKYAMSRSVSRLSLSLPPVLPPLPTYNSFTFFGGNGKRGRSSSWVEEDRFHGPRVSRSRRDSLFSRDGWLGRAPTIPTLMTDDDLEKAQGNQELEQGIKVQKRQSAETLKPSKTAPELPMPEDEAQTSPVRAPSRARVRASVTDTDLRDILRSTEQRLRDGTSRSPSKNSRSSPTKRSPQKISSVRSTPRKNSPTKTPHSHKTISSEDSTNTTGTVRISRIPPSPTKRATIHVVPTDAQSRQVSTSSIGSAANSLIAEATQELVLPGGLSSPSRMRGHQWDAPEDPSPEKQNPQKKTSHKQSAKEDSPDRRASQDSQASSSLSTLYSANDPEEKDQPDPFVERKTPGFMSSESRGSLFGNRASHKRGRNLSISIPGGQSIFNKTGQLRPSFVSTQAVGGPPISSYLQPPPERFQRNDTYSRDQDGIALAFPVSNSYTSILTPSVTTTEGDSTLSLGNRMSESPKPEVPERVRPLLQENRHSVATVPSPSTMTSSPFDEQDMLSLLMGTAPKRALPEPPKHIAQVDQIVMPKPVSPMPRREFSQHLRQMSSTANTIYHDEPPVDSPSAISTGSPLRRSISRSKKDMPNLAPPTVPSMGSLGNSIMELRRMNSMVSSYSGNSLGSSVNEPDSPTLPMLNLTSSFSRRTINPVTPRASMSGRQNYLNLGSPNKNSSGSVVPPMPTRPLPQSRSNRSNLGVEIREDDIDEGKENQEPSSTSSGLRETRRSANMGRDTRDLSRAPSKTKLGTVSELIAESKRDSKRKSVDSIGLYDADGFLKSSPVDAKGRCLRM